MRQNVTPIFLDFNSHLYRDYIFLEYVKRSLDVSKVDSNDSKGISWMGLVNQSIEAKPMVGSHVNVKDENQNTV